MDSQLNSLSGPNPSEKLRVSQGNLRNSGRSKKTKEIKKVGDVYSQSISDSPPRLRQSFSRIFRGNPLNRSDSQHDASKANLEALQHYEEKLENDPRFTNPTEGRTLEDRFFYEGNLLAEEIASRIDTVSIIAGGNRDRIEDLRQTIRSAETGAEIVDPERLGELEHRLDLAEKTREAVETAASKGSSWASSASYRKLLQKTRSLEGADKEYVPACVNLRTQQVKNGEGKVISSLNRSGAVSDYRNGATNAQEMKQISDVLSKIQNVLDLSESETEMLARALPRFSDGFGNATLDEVKVLLNRAIADREFVLENQALEDLTAHFKGIAESEGGLDAYLTSNPKISFGRVSLLDGTKAANIGEEGLFVLSEKNQILDMKHIYDRLNGKEIVFDGKGPFIDTKGRIHMPFDVKQDNAPVVKELNALFFNISTQGNILNEGVQQEINREALTELRTYLNALLPVLPEERKREIELRFEFLDLALNTRVKDGFDLAEVAIDLLSLSDFLVSINCFSGKDRTGEVALMRTLSQLNKIVDALDLSTQKKTALKAKFGRDLLREEGIAYSVVRDNTGHSALKVMVSDLKPLRGSTKRDSILGTVKRARMYLDAAKTFIPPSILGKVKNLESGSGQLHVDE